MVFLLSVIAAATVEERWHVRLQIPYNCSQLEAAGRFARSNRKTYDRLVFINGVRSLNGLLAAFRETRAYLLLFVSALAMLLQHNTYLVATFHARNVSRPVD